jgi:hypothetical protein
VLALAFAGDPDHAGEWRRRIRYGDQPPAYEHRRHFMELQWLPGNVADGLLIDTTARYGSTFRQQREITPAVWDRWGGRRAFALTDEQRPMGTIALDVLTLDDAIAAADRLPDGALVLTVRTNGNPPMWTTHLGFVVRNAPGDPPRMRNATRRNGMQVKDDDLVRYLNHIRAYGRWPVAGVAIFEPVEQQPRRLVGG